MPWPMRFKCGVIYVVAESGELLNCTLEASMDCTNTRTLISADGLSFSDRVQFLRTNPSGVRCGMRTSAEIMKARRASWNTMNSPSNYDVAVELGFFSRPTD